MKHHTPQANPEVVASALEEFQRAHQSHTAGDLSVAEIGYMSVLEKVPTHIGAIGNLAVIWKARGRTAEAIALYRRAIELDRSRAYLHRNLGNALMASGQHAAAVAAYESAIALQPDNVDVRVLRAYGLRQLGRMDEALASLTLIVASAPNNVAALQAMGELRLAQGDATAATACFTRVLELDPRAENARHNLGCAFSSLGRWPDARRLFEEAIARTPRRHQSHASLGNALLQLEGPQAALPHYRKAVELAPNYTNGWFGLGAALSRTGAAHEARKCFERVLELAPEHLGARVAILGDARKQGDFESAELHVGALLAHLPRTVQVSHDWRSLANVAYSDIFDPLGTEIYGLLTSRLDDLFTNAARQQRLDRPPSRPAAVTNDRIRIGYLSPNFRDHPVGHVTRSLFRHHRRDRFEVHGFSTAFRPDHPDYTAEIKQSFDHYHVLGKKSAAESAEVIRAAGIDILIDLDGYMDCSSPPILALRPAPIQVFWLGHAGGLGLSFVDYLIADAVVVPVGEEVLYRERIVRLPHVYHCADRPPIAAEAPSRAECGLPETGFVFCAFNNPQKIRPETFDCWMRILTRVSDSCLWLSDPWARAELVDNFRTRAKRLGVVPERLVFARRVRDKSVHLARHCHAGLFLDTVGSLSASTTALDALWSDVPLLTVKGERFASRIATTMLHGLGFKELVCESLAEYEERAVAYGQNFEETARLSGRIREAKHGQPLFRIEAFVHDLETAYERMWALKTAGHPPAAFDVVGRC